MCYIIQGLVNVPLEHHPTSTIGDIISNRFEGDGQNPQKGTFTNPCYSQHNEALDIDTATALRMFTHNYRPAACSAKQLASTCGMDVAMASVGENDSVFHHESSNP